MENLEAVTREIKEIKLMLEKIEAIVDSRLIGEVEPDEDEIRAIEYYEKRKKSGGIVLKPLDE